MDDITKKKCDYCENKLGFSGNAIMQKWTNTATGKEGTNYFHSKCYEVGKRYERLKRKPAWFDYLRRNGIEPNPNLFKVTK